MTIPPEVKITIKLARMTGDDAQKVQQEYVKFYNFMLTRGEKPKRNQGYNKGTADKRIDRLDQIHRLIIDRLDPEDVIHIKKEHADKLMHAFKRGDITKQRSSDADDRYSDSSLRKFQNVLETYFEWLYLEKDIIDERWESPVNFTDEEGKSADRFTYPELGRLLAEAMEYGSLPSYYEASPETKDKIDALVAQRLGMPKEEVSQKDWLEADHSTKIYSLILVGYDAGLAPSEIEEATIDWYEPQSGRLRIPTEHACKEREKEVVALSDKAAKALDRWLRERRQLPTYDDTNKIWLNQASNPYDSGNLCYLIKTLCERADIPTENRKIVWYSLRQTMGRNITDEGSLSEANDQLRHKHLSTTQEKYNQTPVEKRRERLNETHDNIERSQRDRKHNTFADSSSNSADDPAVSSSEDDARNDSVDDSRTTQSEDTSDHESSPSDATHEPRWGDPEDVITWTDDGGIHIDPSVLDTEYGLIYVFRLLLKDISND